MKGKYAPNPPTWFKTRNYDYVSQLDEYGWLIALFVRSAFEQELLAGNQDKVTLWEEFRTATNNLIQYKPRTITGLKSIEEVYPPIEEKHIESNSRQFLLSVDLWAPDGILTQDFSDWLKNKRSEFPSPIKRSGPKSKPNTMITKTHFNRWTKQRILPLFDLMFAKKLKIENVSDSQIGNWLFPDIGKSDPQDKFNYSRDVLNDALDSLEALQFQLKNSGKK